MRVLLVEDEPATAKTVELMLKSQGHECVIAELGEDAVRLATGEDYDVILLDVMLPDIDGYEVLRRLHAAEVHTPVLIQSSLVSRDETAQGLGFGVEDFLVKPFSRSELDARMENAVRRTESESEAAPVEPESEAAPAAPDSMPPPATAHGARPGKKVLMAGQIVFQGGNCTMDCLVLEISEGGAALKPDDPLEFPKNFDLNIKFGPSHRCELCWQYGDKVGVRFLDA